MSLSSVQPGDNSQLRRLLTVLRMHPPLVEHYLLTHVLPAIMHHQQINISASGADLSSEIFDKRLGFSGTPSELLPLSLGKCLFERGAEGQIVSVLSSPSVVTVRPVRRDWSVMSLLRAVARSRFHALIDTGALITGLSNIQTAAILLALGLEHVDGVVYLDDEDKPQVCL